MFYMCKYNVHYYNIGTHIKCLYGIFIQCSPIKMRCGWGVQKVTARSYKTHKRAA